MPVTVEDFDCQKNQVESIINRYDIFLSKDGEEIQPTGPVEVVIVNHTGKTEGLAVFRKGTDGSYDYIPSTVTLDSNQFSVDLFGKFIIEDRYVGQLPQIIPCDVDGDGEITPADARLILRASVGLEDTAGWKKKTKRRA